MCLCHETPHRLTWGLQGPVPAHAWPPDASRPAVPWHLTRRCRGGFTGISGPHPRPERGLRLPEARCGEGGGAGAKPPAREGRGAGVRFVPGDPQLVFSLGKPWSPGGTRRTDPAPGAEGAARAVGACGRDTGTSSSPGRVNLHIKAKAGGHQHLFEIPKNRRSGHTASGGSPDSGPSGGEGSNEKGRGRGQAFLRVQTTRAATF